LPLSIIGAKRLYTTLVDILSALFLPSCTFILTGFFQLGVIGYWSTAFAAIVLTEHFIFRRSSFSAYNTAHWDQARLLPPGVAAILAFLGAFGIIIPSMSQTWYTGPIAKAGSGDIGIYTGGVVAVSLYILLRTVERKMWPGR
jgi:purine-cytosine permease-like protein